MKANSVIDYSAVGSRAFSEERRQSLLRDERIISGNDYETAILYKADGTRGKPKKGTKNEVVFSKKEIAEMQGGVLTHNHPDGSVFSPNDINMMRQGKLSEIRACNSKGAYVLRSNSEWNSEISSWEKIKKQYWDCMNEAGIKYRDIAAQEGKPLFMYLKRMDEDGIELFAKRYGLEFKWEDII